MLSIAHSVGQCRGPPGAASSQRLLPHPPRSGFHRQRPYLRPQTLLAQAVQQTCSDQPQEQPDVCTPAKGLAAALTTCATALATAFVAVSPAAATLAPADISQLQETLTEVWGKLDPLGHHSCDPRESRGTLTMNSAQFGIDTCIGSDSTRLPEMNMFELMAMNRELACQPESNGISLRFGLLACVLAACSCCMRIKCFRLNLTPAPALTLSVSCQRTQTAASLTPSTALPGTQRGR